VVIGNYLGAVDQLQLLGLLDWSSLLASVVDYRLVESPHQLFHYRASEGLRRSPLYPRFEILGLVCASAMDRVFSTELLPNS
jgi:hypothetical protein